MDLTRYKKTRYENIYQNIKNKNYIIRNGKMCVSTINGEKIYDKDIAIKLRDGSLTSKNAISDTFDNFFDKYLLACKKELKLAYNTILKKQKVYNKYLKGKFRTRPSKLTKRDLAYFIDKQNCSDKTKNEIIKTLKAFYSWMNKEEFTANNPAVALTKYKTEKAEMKFWNTEQIMKFMNEINKELDTKDLIAKEKAYRIKMLVLIELSLGCRIGEARALTYDSINKTNSTITIAHSINYNPHSDDFLSSTKNYSSQRVLTITEPFIEELEAYYRFNQEFYEISPSDLIFMNYKTNRPISETTLRTDFKEYCDLFGIPHIRLYDLRHTYVALCMEDNKELYLISERLGHSSYSTTIDKYGHLSNSKRKEIAEYTNQFLYKN